MSLQGGQSQQFSATVQNLSNSNVNWTLSPTVGTISSSGLYTAPASVATQQTVTVTATSQVNSSVSGSATVTLLPPITDLFLSNLSLSSGTYLYQALNSITASDNFTISGSANVTFQAGNVIHLNPGFQATGGSAATTFHALISQ